MNDIKVSLSRALKIPWAPSGYKTYTSDRMHGMIKTEARLFILWLLFRYACLPNWKYAAAKIHRHFLEGTFKEAIFFLFWYDAPR